MSQNRALLPHLRRQKIKELIATTTQGEIAKQCNCERRTIVRDIIEMKASGEWWDWLEHEFIKLYQDVDVSKDFKFREIAKLYGKQFIKEKSETNVQGDINLKWMNSHEPNPHHTL